VVRLLCAVLGVLVALSVPTACGGSGTLTKSQYVSSLNALCRDFSSREKTIGEPQTIDDLAERGSRVADAFEKAIADKVHDLKAPAEIADQANRMADLADEQLKVLRGLADAAKRSDFGKLGDLAAKNSMLNKESGTIARKLGATDCS
jgi:hypothetical protein